MACRTASRPKKTAARTLRLDGDVLTIRDGKVRTYRLERIDDPETGDRLGFRLRKDDGAVYDVDTVDARCDCIGHERYGRCVHAAAIYRLLDLRRI